MHTLLILVATLTPAASPKEALEPWASKRHPQDVARRHVEEITAAKQEYRIHQGGTMDGTNCRSPIGGGFGIWEQTWESNRAVRLENIGDTEVINPWLSNGRNDFRSLAEIVARAVKPGMSDREKAIALWRLQTTHRFHAGTGDNEVNDPVKVFNVYGYTTCGNDSICLAGLWHVAGLQVRPARCPGHCISQVFYQDRWHLLDGDMGPFYLLRDNRTIAGEQDLVRDHDLLKRSHTGGILDPDSRTIAEAFAGLFVSENEWKGNRNSVRDTTMNMVLRPHEALVWCWGHLVPLKYHGRIDIKVFGPRHDLGPGKVWGAHAAERICNGRWEYRPDFSRDIWRKGTEKTADVQVERGELVPAAGKTGTVVWKMRSPYPFVGGHSTCRARGSSSSCPGTAPSGRRWTMAWMPFSISRTKAMPVMPIGSNASWLRPDGSSASPSRTICKWRRSPSPAWWLARIVLPTAISPRAPGRCASHTNGWSARCLGRRQRRLVPFFRPIRGERMGPTSSFSGRRRRSPLGSGSRITTSSFPIVRTWLGRSHPTSRS